MTSTPRRQYVVKARSSQKVLLDQLYRDHHRSVLAYCLRRADREMAYDIAAEVFVVAVRRAEEIPRGDATLPWLYGTAFKVLSNQRRTAKRFRLLARRAAEITAESFPGPDVVVVRRSEYEQVAKALEQLPFLDREVLRLATWEELPRQQIAQILGISRSGVDKRITRALQRTRRRLNIPSPSANEISTHPPEGTSE